jgi:hypothetical protein
MKLWKFAAGGLTAAVMAGCAGGEPPPPPRSPAPAPAPPPVSEADQCGARAAQAYVGRPRSEIPVPVQPELQRVACTTCPVTMDYNPRRLNFLYDADTGIVRQVKCG